MTQEEAIRRIKARFDKWALDDEDMKAIQTLIPELKQSDDERIRESLIKFLTEIKDISESGRTSWAIRKEDAEMCKSFIDYLEKQKEQSITANDLDEEIHRFFDDCIEVHDAKIYGVDERVITVDCYEITARHFAKWGEKQKEHKAAEFTHHETNESLKDAVTHQMEDDGDIDDFVRKGIDDVVLKYAKLGAKWQKEQKPIETTICGQDYKCKKDYMTSTCRYIKDAIYHCSRDGYLNDQNGVSWSCTPEWFKEYIQSNTEWAEEEKTRFVSGQFLQCKLSFDEFKEGEHYWLEYVGDDMYVGRSDNILNQKFHITPRQLFTLFSQQLEEVQGPPQEEKQVSLNYEPPFNENPSDNEIIEALIHHLNEQDGFLTAINCVSNKAILRWLEKQKEQKPAEVDESTKRLNENWMKQYFDEQKPVITHGETYHVDTLGTQQVIAGKMPQKSAEWSEEDEQRIAEIEFAVMQMNTKRVDTKDKCLAWLKSLRPQPKQEWSEEDVYIATILEHLVGKNRPNEIFKLGNKQGISAYKICSWLKNLPERFNLQPKQELSEEDRTILKVITSDVGRMMHKCGVGTDEWNIRSKAIRWLETLCPNQKSDWSEEDENKLNHILEIVHIASGSEASVNEKEELESFLKSLRPSWKPSEEQLDALRASNSYWKGTTNEVPRTDLLESLYNDLEKLIAKR